MANTSSGKRSEEGTAQRGGALAGLRILDFTRFYSGPFATLLLAGYGAEVIRIDRPAEGEPAMSGPPFYGSEGVSLDRQDERDLGLAYLKRCRGKKAITLDFARPEGMRLFHELLRTADVVVENFRPGVADKLGVGYEQNAKINPRIIHCAITGYGSTGPDANLKAYDLMVQADSGLMSITGNPEGPPRKAGSALADGISGAFAVSGILAAVVERQRSGVGQFVDVAMTDCLVSLVLDEPLDCYERFGLAPRQGNRIMRFSPFDTFETADGDIAIGCATNTEWRALLTAIDRRDLEADANFMNTGWRVANVKAVNAIVAQWTRVHTTDEVLDALRRHDVPASPIRTINDLMTWDHLRERRMLEDVAHPVVGSPHPAIAAGFPVKLSRTPGGYQRGAPSLGQDNEEIYAGALGIEGDALRALKDNGVI
ncbi:formyl-coenzyme A transferase [Variibacter gotjawalensis]|uniref:Formyl-coenzyme A transferase n=1 Tax=Variibacter gotjawalensis TaxID=1333996 RepID=A0A0S3PUE7_9BRAD|nr:CaiB/BaiF CoA-transferase family protein [Variibacter gotjawalensis]NIK49911.1 crotonobetainyl-CoA:carnitine CoA-transferase CaiB-like acyl-CoA transferase [Variibacter gotjawalensis]RZS45910.1 crotonobetainyl-CoA:carnitine CoA-transferase CaiB-like acyl-CoA transferase [Variibacter gotjawalensis]BAT59585.1 formyl-coenzyme A transferase [Variibacter gotjawalensis]